MPVFIGVISTGRPKCNNIAHNITPSCSPPAISARLSWPILNFTEKFTFFPLKGEEQNIAEKSAKRPSVLEPACRAKERSPFPQQKGLLSLPHLLKPSSP